MLLKFGAICYRDFLESIAAVGSLTRRERLNGIDLKACLAFAARVDALRLYSIEYTHR